MAVAAKLDLDSLCGAFGGLSRDPPRDPRPARARGPELRGDRPADGHEPPGRGVHALPRAPAPDRGVRRHRLRRPLPADPGHHRHRRAVDAGHARHAPARPPPLALPAVPARGAGRRARPRAVHAPERARAGRHEVAGILPFPIFAKLRGRGAADAASPPAGPRRAGRAAADALRSRCPSGWGKAAAGAAVLVAGVGAGVGVKQATTTATTTGPPRSSQRPRRSRGPTPRRRGPTARSSRSGERDAASTSDAGTTRERGRVQVPHPEGHGQARRACPAPRRRPRAGDEAPRGGRAHHRSDSGFESAASRIQSKPAAAEKQAGAEARDARGRGPEDQTHHVGDDRQPTRPAR